MADQAETAIARIEGKLDALATTKDFAGLEIRLMRWVPRAAAIGGLIGGLIIFDLF